MKKFEDLKIAVAGTGYVGLSIATLLAQHHKVMAVDIVPEKVELIFTEYMKKTISIRDTFARKPTKENFYHGLLLGILGFKENWSVMSNRESGDGFGDILIRIEDEDVGIVIEVKYADNGNLQGECEKALQQIIDIRYTEALEQEGIHTIIKYGIACYRKKCKVLMRIDKQ